MRKQVNKRLKKMEGGGPFKFSDDEDQNSDITKGITAGGNLLGGVIDAIDSPDAYGVRSTGGAVGSGALKGAAAGAALGPEGAVIGAAIGGVTSLLGNNKMKKERRIATAANMTSMAKKNTVISNSIMASDLTNVTGRKGAQMYKYGGSLKGSAPSTTFKLPSALVSTPKVDLLPDIAINPRKMMANGGQLAPLNEDAVEVKGPSHANGGVKFPQLGVELEGGETVSDGFVFSKKLGFADQHKKIAKAIGDVEKKPQTPEALNTLKALTSQEDRLKIKQEQTKQQLGIPSSLNKMANGGPITKEDREKQRLADAEGSSFEDNSKPTSYWDAVKKRNALTQRKGQYTNKAEEASKRKIFFQDKSKGVGDYLQNLILAPQKEMNHLLTGNYESPVDSYERYNGKIKSGGKRLAADIATDPMMWPELPALAAKGAWKGAAKAAPFVADAAVKAGTYVAEHAAPVVAKAGKYLAKLPLGKIAETGYKVADRGLQALAHAKDNEDETPATTAKTTNKSIPNPFAPAGSNPWVPGALAGGNSAGTGNYALLANSSGAKAPGASAVSSGRRSGTGRSGSSPASSSKAKTPLTYKASPVSDSVIDVPASLKAAQDKQNADLSAAATAKTLAANDAGSTSIKALQAATPTPAAKTGTDFGKAADAITPFISNIANAFRKLPKPPAPTMQEAVTPALVNYDADRAEGVRQRRGADQAAALNLNGGNAVTASRAANLSQEIRGSNAVSQAENNTNAGIKNQFSQLNASISANNNAKTDQYNAQLVERQLKQQELTSDNLADIGNKQQMMSRDQKLFDLENDKLMLAIGSDPTGASFRTMQGVLKKRMPAASYAQLAASEALKKPDTLQDSKQLLRKPGNPVIPGALTRP